MAKILNLANKYISARNNGAATYQFSENELLDFVDLLLLHTKKRIILNKYTGGDIQVSHNPDQLNWYNRAIDDSTNDIEQMMRKKNNND